MWNLGPNDSGLMIIAVLLMGLGAILFAAAELVLRWLFW
jgi:hypothetical protein